jgi:hypothetical protein
MGIGETNHFVAFSKRFNHFAVCPVFLSYLEVSDYLKLRQVCLYLHDWYNYSVLEILIKFGNLDDALRKNLWYNVCPIIAIQRKYRENLDSVIRDYSIKHARTPSFQLQAINKDQNSDFGSVYCHVYSEILETAEEFENLTEKVNQEIELFKDVTEQWEESNKIDMEVLRNISLWFYFLSPNDSNGNLFFVNQIHQVLKDEEMTFWILLCIMEKLKIQKTTEFKHLIDIKTLEILTKEYCPQFYDLMVNTKQLEDICNKMLVNFGSQYFEPEQSLSLIDSFLVCEWRGLYERIIILFSHIESLIGRFSEEDGESLSTSKPNENPNLQFLPKTTEKNKYKDTLNSYRMASIWEKSNNTIMEGADFDSLNKDDLAFSVFVELVENFHITYIVNIKDSHLEKTRKLALKALIEAWDTVPEKEKMNEMKFKKMK